MAERNPDREDPQQGDGPAETEPAGAEPTGSGGAPLDEEAAWAEIVAAFDEDSVEPPHERAARAAAEGEGPAGGAADGPADGPADAGGGVATAEGPADPDEDGGPGDGAKSGGPGGGDGASFIVFSAGTGPRDWEAAEASDDDLDETDEGHFVPPEPPPLPKADTTTKFAWLAVLGGPLLLLGMLIFQQPMTWWASVLGIGGFLGGFATLVARMRPGGDDDDEPPGGGAVV
ncbi:hypothetical protein OG946_08010 [Streptomyces sp. NBC_01808]|uniref:hypothetical protein n=1 Tax=Streptomyces sp. NBC_01808 TaxID=2975947 RepID=UPI002DD8D160|nr:hypothetical protein [Streptomyces sp. NBC_01808]WSA37322.1 hypothetical protein OG946_08010 [Streptomyces sp. NBC_01808]